MKYVKEKGEGDEDGEHRARWRCLQLKLCSYIFSESNVSFFSSASRKVALRTQESMSLYLKNAEHKIK